MPTSVPNIPFDQEKAEFPPINEVVLKLASRCNINCTYCYWFNDPLVMQSPKMLQAEAQKMFVDKLLIHIKHYQLKSFSIAFHGGEPTLFPKDRFESLCESLVSIEQQTGCKIALSMQTNALLIEDEWIRLLKKFSVRLGISLDGSKALHDFYRIDAKGRGTYLKTLKAIKRIREGGLEVYILSVASIQAKPNELLDHFVKELNLKDFDVLMPHLHHQDAVLSLAGYWNEMFDRYIDELVDQDVNIRILDDLMCQIIGGNSTTQGLGFISTVTLLTDGQLEATDDLRMIDGLAPSKINIKSHSLQQVTEDLLWQEVYFSSLNLSDECNACEYKQICGGGPMVSRWSSEKRFNNPSVYCGDYKQVIQHMQKRLEPYIATLNLEKNNERSLFKTSRTANS